MVELLKYLTISVLVFVLLGALYLYFRFVIWMICLIIEIYENIFK